MTAPLGFDSLGGYGAYHRGMTIHWKVGIAMKITMADLARRVSLVGEGAQARLAEDIVHLVCNYSTAGTWLDATAKHPVALRKNGTPDPHRMQGSIGAWLMAKDIQQNGDKAVLTPELAVSIVADLNTESLQYDDDIKALVSKHQAYLANKEALAVSSDANGENLDKIPAYSERAIKQADAQLDNGADPIAVAAKLRAGMAILEEKASALEAKALVTA